MNLVVDCSCMMSTVLQDERSNYMENVFVDIINNRYNTYVPAVFYLECNNVIISGLRRKRISKEDYENYINIVSRLPLSVDKFSSAVESVYMLGNIAMKYDLTSYDASYLELALRMDAVVATLDKKLIKACEDANITLIT